MGKESTSPSPLVPRERLVVFLLFAVPVLIFVAPALPRFFSAAIGLPSLLCVNISLGYGSVNPRDVDAAQRVSPLLLFPKFLSLPLMKQARVPARWAFPLITLVIAVAGCGMHGLLVRMRRPAWRLTLIGALCIAAGLETAHTSTPTNGFELPKAYEAIGTAQDPTDMIIEWPIFFFCGMKGPTGYNYDRLRMVWAMQHRYRIVSGYLSRIPFERFKAILNQPLIRDLWIMQGDDPGFVTDTEPTDMKTIQRWLMVNNVYFIVLNKKANYQQPLEYLKKNNIAEPGYEDAQYVVMKIAR